MNQTLVERITSQKFLDSLLPPEKSDQFFEALYGEASEGTYDIRLVFSTVEPDRIVFAFHLVQRPGKCLVCSLTYGLPTVFSRHPLINIKGMINKIKEEGLALKGWDLGDTREISSSLHLVPLYLYLG